ncbi:MAG: SAM-dependent methyltransferase [Nitrosopumilaceae archaeon]|nr:SAM-dependent methyltransferase [Nitrosopumilaceae archaeon]
MKIEDYIHSLPENIISGQDVNLTEKSLREIFDFVKIGKDDVFYHLGCGDEKGIKIDSEEYHVKKAIGIDNDFDKIKNSKEKLEQTDSCKLICSDIQKEDISDASVILFWFTDENIINEMMSKFEKLKEGTRIVTIWGPLPYRLPDRVNFPYIINTVPFKKAKTMSEQLLAIFGVKCIDFITAWEFAERYTKTLQRSDSQNDRFVTILQTLIIWINAKNLGVACGDEIPESIKTYIGIMKTYFDIDFEHLLKK